MRDLNEAYIAVDDDDVPVVIAYDELAFTWLMRGLPVVEELE